MAQLPESTTVAVQALVEVFKNIDAPWHFNDIDNQPSSIGGRCYYRVVNFTYRRKSQEDQKQIGKEEQAGHTQVYVRKIRGIWVATAVEVWRHEYEHGIRFFQLLWDQDLEKIVTITEYPIKVEKHNWPKFFGEWEEVVFNHL